MVVGSNPGEAVCEEPREETATWGLLLAFRVQGGFAWVPICTLVKRLAFYPLAPLDPAS